MTDCRHRCGSGGAEAPGSAVPVPGAQTQDEELILIVPTSRVKGTRPDSTPPWLTSGLGQRRRWSPVQDRWTRKVAFQFRGLGMEKRGATGRGLGPRLCKSGDGRVWTQWFGRVRRRRSVLGEAGQTPVRFPVAARSVFFRRRRSERDKLRKRLCQSLSEVWYSRE